MSKTSGSEFQNKSQETEHFRFFHRNAFKMLLLRLKIKTFKFVCCIILYSFIYIKLKKKVAVVLVEHCNQSNKQLYGDFLRFRDETKHMRV